MPRIVGGLGKAAGTGAAAATGSSIAAGVGAASGTGRATGSGVNIGTIARAGTAAGIGTATAVAVRVHKTPTPAPPLRHSADNYAQAFAALLPRGVAWPRDPDTVLMLLVAALAQVWGYVDGRAADLLEIEGDPRTADTMLEDWERNSGLPDPCMGGTVTDLTKRRALLSLRMLAPHRGNYGDINGQSRAWFKEIGTLLGYSITIEERKPVVCGISNCGDWQWQIGSPGVRAWWTVHTRTGAQALDLECLIRRYKPGHSHADFSYDL
jgi:uncharacterized protein YmfQ (DUF2313 family)